MSSQGFNALGSSLTNNAFPSSSETDGWHYEAINAFEAWESGYTGAGVHVSVSDNGMYFGHPDLDDNLLYDESLNTFTAFHGTAVAGIIGAESNGFGVAGIAYNTQIDSQYMWFEDPYSYYPYLEHADIMNNSWREFDVRFQWDDEAEERLDHFVTHGREGLGLSLVFVAGNDREEGFTANHFFHPNHPDTIAVAAVEEGGVFAPYSNAGSSVLISAPTDILTTNIDNGYSVFNGTSAATPVVSGVIALMLEANPELGYRDIQNILSYSAQMTDQNSSQYGITTDNEWQYNGATNWNGCGGMHYNQDYGFGLVDAQAAVLLAETWDEQSTKANEVTEYVAFEYPAATQAIPTIDDDPSVLEISFSFGAGTTINVETALVTLDIDALSYNDYVDIDLISPSGTEAHIYTGYYNDGLDIHGAKGGLFGFTANVFRGEESNGIWTLEISGTEGMYLNSVYAEINGSEASVDGEYIYTNQYAELVAAGTHCREIHDTDGGIDTINASMVTSDSHVDLSRKNIFIDNEQVFLSEKTTIEKVYTGNGNDLLIGDHQDNVLFGGRGDDTLVGGGGDDVFIFGMQTGKDTIKDFGYMTNSKHHEYLPVHSKTIEDAVFYEFDGRGSDIIQLKKNAGFKDFEDLKLFQKGADTFIDLDPMNPGHHVITLENIRVGDITTEHFTFI